LSWKNIKIAIKSTMLRRENFPQKQSLRHKMERKVIVQIGQWNQLQPTIDQPWTTESQYRVIIKFYIHAFMSLLLSQSNRVTGHKKIFTIYCINTFKLLKLGQMQLTPTIKLKEIFQMHRLQLFHMIIKK
jgi:hypothetical protein